MSLDLIQESSFVLYVTYQERLFLLPVMNEELESLELDYLRHEALSSISPKVHIYHAQVAKYNFFNYGDG